MESALSIITRKHEACRDFNRNMGQHTNKQINVYKVVRKNSLDVVQPAHTQTKTHTHTHKHTRKRTQTMLAQNMKALKPFPIRATFCNDLCTYKQTNPPMPAASGRVDLTYGNSTYSKNYSLQFTEYRKTVLSPPPTPPKPCTPGCCW